MIDSTQEIPKENKTIKTKIFQLNTEKVIKLII